MTKVGAAMGIKEIVLSSSSEEDDENDQSSEQDGPMDTVDDWLLSNNGEEPQDMDDLFT